MGKKEIIISIPARLFNVPSRLWQRRRVIFFANTFYLFFMSFRKIFSIRFLNIAGFIIMGTLLFSSLTALAAAPTITEVKWGQKNGAFELRCFFCRCSGLYG